MNVFSDLKDESISEVIEGYFFDENLKFEYINNKEKGCKILTSLLEGYIHVIKKIDDYYIIINNFSSSCLSLAKCSDIDESIIDDPIKLLESIYDKDFFTMETVRDINDFWTDEKLIFKDGSESESLNINFNLLNPFISSNSIENLKEEFWD